MQKDELLKKVHDAASGGLTLPQIASEVGIDLNRFIGIFFSDSDVRMAFERGVTHLSKNMLENIRTIAESPMHKQCLHAAIYLHKHAMNAHSASGQSVDSHNDGTIGAKVAAIINPEVMQKIADSHANRIES
jgi:hypothetical protein